MAMSADMRNLVLARCWATAVRKSGDESLPLTQQWRPNFSSVWRGLEQEPDRPARSSIQRAWDAQTEQECALFQAVHAEATETRGKAAAQEMGAQWRGMMGVYMQRLNEKAVSQEEWDAMDLETATRATVAMARLGNFLLPLAPDLVGVTELEVDEQTKENVVELQAAIEAREQKLRELG